MILPCRWSSPIAFRSRAAMPTLRGWVPDLLGWLFGLAVLSAAMPAFGQYVPVAETYVVRPVSADVTAGDATEAREQALLRAQRSAFETLAQRLSPPGHAAPPVPGTAALQAMVQAVEVLEEKTSPVRYVGTFAVTFGREPVRRYFDETGVPLIPPPTRPVVVLPVLRTADLPVLWDGRTDWRTAWENRVTSGSLLPLLVPPGELQDVAAISAEEALAADAEPLRRIGTVYSTETVVVAALTALAEGEAQVELTRYESGRRVDRRSLTVAAGPGSVEARAADQAVLALEAAWKRERSVAGTEAALPVRVAGILNLEEWVSVRRRLAGERLVVRTEVERLTRREADLTLHYRGDTSALGAALARLDLALTAPGEAVPGTAAGAAADPVGTAPVRDDRWRLTVTGPGPVQPALTALTPRLESAFDDTESDASVANDARSAQGDSVVAPVGDGSARPTASEAAAVGTVLDVTELDFRDRVAAAPVPALVYFRADWCSFCSAVDAPVEALAQEMAGQVVVARVDVDRAPVVAKAYDIMAIPAFLVLRDATVVAQRQGRLSRAELTAWVQEAMQQQTGGAAVSAGADSALGVPLEAAGEAGPEPGSGAPAVP